MNYDSIIQRYAPMFGVPATFVAAVIETESGGDPRAYRAEPQLQDASRGLMQLLYSTASGLGYGGVPDGLYDPDTNIFFGTKLLADLRRRYGTDPRRVYSAYNSGSPDRWLTSATVAANVERFMRILNAQETAAAETEPEPIGAQPVFFVTGLAALAFILWR